MAPDQAAVPPARKEELQSLEQRLGYRFQTVNLLDQALRHSSYAHENPESGPSNEQLEFLGDAVLSLTVSTLLLARFPRNSEGDLTRGRAALVNGKQLATLARDLGLGPLLRLGRGEERQDGRQKPSLLADALEAVLAAVYLDGGLEAAANLTERWFSPVLEAAPPWEDSKSSLQELTQARFKASPAYHLVAASGPDHARLFQVEVSLNDRPLAQGEGRTKKQAEQKAAQLALDILQEKEADTGNENDAG